MSHQENDSLARALCFSAEIPTCICGPTELHGGLTSASDLPGADWRIVREGQSAKIWWAGWLSARDSEKHFSAHCFGLQWAEGPIFDSYYLDPNVLYFLGSATRSAFGRRPILRRSPADAYYAELWLRVFFRPPRSVGGRPRLARRPFIYCEGS